MVLKKSNIHTDDGPGGSWAETHGSMETKTNKKRTIIMKNYYTLLVLHKTEESNATKSGWALPGDKWTPEFGSFDKKEVEEERDYVWIDGDGFTKKETKIICTEERQEAVDWQVKVLNAEIQAGYARFSPVYHTAKKGGSHNRTIVVGGKDYQVETKAERDRADDSKAQFVIGINGIHYTYPVEGNPGAFDDDGYVTRYAREALARMEIRKANKLLK